ncbi:MAG: enoyl-CoA hydratase/isomerase family protein [Nostocoides sp.]
MSGHDTRAEPDGFSAVSLDVAEGVATVTFERADQLNSLNLDLAEEIGDAVNDAAGAGARAVVLTGRGRAFCAGADLGMVSSALSDPHAVLTPLVEKLHTSIRQMRSTPIPIIAAVEGTAAGAGMGLALAADLRVLGRSATLLPAYMAIGASPDGGVSAFLTRAVGAARATSLLLTNHAVTAAEALDWGLAEEVTDDGGALAAAQQLATSLTGTAPLALLRVRELVDTATAAPLSQHLDLEQQRVTELWATHDFGEGIRAFLERRRPGFTGR